MADYTGCKCPVCQQPFSDGDDVVVCPECGAPYHRACYQKNAGCLFADRHAPGFEWKPAPGEMPNRETASASQDEIACPACGAMNPAGGLFCESCGAPLRAGGPRYAPGSGPAASGPASYGPAAGPQGYSYTDAQQAAPGMLHPDEDLGGAKLIGENHDVVRIMTIHKSKGLNDHNIPYADRVLYPIDIAECIEKAKQPLPFAVQSYVTLLKNMAKNNVIMQNATKLLELDDKTLNEIYQLTVAYNDIPNAKRELIENALKGEYQGITFDLKGDTYLQIWNEDDYKRHGCWVTVCVYRDRYGVFLTTTKGDSRANEYIEAAGYTHQESEGRYDWYYHKDATKRFFKNAELNEVINNVKALLNILAW